MARNYVPIDRVMEELRRYPDGVTTRQLASVLGLHPHSLANRLSKAFLWGRGVDRTECEIENYRQYIWIAK